MQKYSDDVPGETKKSDVPGSAQGGWGQNNLTDALDWNLIKILAKENNYWKHRSKQAYLIVKHKDKVPL